MFVLIRCMGSRHWQARADLGKFGSVIVFVTGAGDEYCSIRWDEPSV